MKEKQVILNNVLIILTTKTHIRYFNIILIFIADRGYREELEKEEKRASYDRYIYIYIYRLKYSYTESLYLLLINFINS